MQIDVRKTIKDYDGEDVMDTIMNKKTQKSEQVSLTVRSVLSNSLNNYVPNELQPAEEKARIYQLSQKLYATNEPNFTVDEMAFIKEKVAKAYNPLVYGRIGDLFENQTKK